MLVRDRLLLRYRVTSRDCTVDSPSVPWFRIQTAAGPFVELDEDRIDVRLESQRLGRLTVPTIAE